MLDGFGCWFLGFFQDDCSLEGARVLADTLQKVVTSVALLVGGIWAYFRFVSGRTLKRRLEVAVRGEAIRSGESDKTRVFVTATAKNVGLARVGLDREETGLRVLTPEAEGPTVERTAGGGDQVVSATREDEPPTYLARWIFLETEPIFTETKGLEPGETATDQILVEVPGIGLHAVKLELWVASPPKILLLRFGRKWWRVTAVVRAGTRVDNEDGPTETPGPDPKGR